MNVLCNRHGVAIVLGQHVISLGWNVWGWDGGPDRYAMLHVYPFRMFVKLR